MSECKPGVIGIFDSGVGGLSVWREVARQLPHERTLYLADQAHVPYGSRRLAEVREWNSRGFLCPAMQLPDRNM